MTSHRRNQRLAAAIVTALAGHAAHAELPVPCVAGTCGSLTWQGSGSGSLVQQGQNLTINQTSSRALFNWQSFNVGADATVTFRQPSATAVAINRIFQANPSRILGRLNANGQVYLINTNGIVFGRGAQVNVGSLVASSLNLTDSALDKGLVRALSEDGQPAFVAAHDAAGNVTSGQVIVESGASITSGNGGQILLFAPNVTNSGTLSTPNGQAILAAGTKIYLSIDPANKDLRGLLVEVDVAEVSDADLQKFAKGEITELPIGRVTNLGSISASTGNVSMAGLAVNQMGRVSATTSVRSNGTIYLRAADRPNSSDLANGVLNATRGGKVVLGEGSVTEVTPDTADTSTTVDVNAQPLSQVAVTGTTVQMLRNSTIRATGGIVSVSAQANPSDSEASLAGAAANSSRFVMLDGARIDVSGATAALSADSHTVTVQLFSEQLRDSPLQRDGALRGQPITVDMRNTGTRADGTTWVGTPLADVSGAVDAIARGVAERSTTGGQIRIVSQGDVIVSPGAMLDVSGGRIDYQQGYVRTTQLVSNGRVYDISQADPNRVYDGIAGQISRTDSKWGVTQTWSTPGSATYTDAYSEGADAGSITINSARLVLDGNVQGSVTTGPYQRQPADAPRGGSLVVGYAAGGALTPANFRMGSIVFGDSRVLDTLTGFDPLKDPLPASLDTTVLRTSLLGEQGVSRLAVYSNGSITVPSDVALAVPAGGAIELRADAIDVAGTITARSGTVTLVAQRTVASVDGVGHDVTLDTGARIDARGLWTNDYLNGTAPPQGPLWIDGGTVALRAANGNIVLASGSSIDASGSGWVRADGTLRDGKGGTISLAVADAGNDSTVVLDGDLTATGLFRGGSLSVTADAVCIAASACAGLDPASGFGTLVLAPAFFEQGGFSSYSVAAKRGDLVVAGDAAVMPLQVNRVVGDDYRARATGSELEDFSTLQVLDADRRQATSITLATTGPTPSELRIEAGASIVTDPRGTIALRSRSRMYVDGLLQASGGTIDLALSRHPSATNYSAGDVIWVGRDAVLDASGAALLAPDALGRRVGEVIAGGTIKLRADRGFVVAESGSLLDVSGDAAQLDIRGSEGLYAARTVASNAGTISVTSAEGAVLEGRLEGAAGGSNARGGTLALVIDGNNRGEPNSDDLPDGSNNYPHGPRIIRVVPGEALGSLTGVGYDNFGTTYGVRDAVGVTRIGTDTIANGGFDSLALTARPLLSNNQFATAGERVRAQGIVELAADLSLGRRLVIDSPLIAVADGHVTVSAPYVALGSTFNEAVPDPVANGGNRTLDVRAQWIDLVGHAAVTGASTVHLSADDDLRMRPVPQLNSSSRALEGSFAVAGDLEIRADQIYPTTLTDFTLRAADVDGAPGSITVLPGDARRAVLSAGGSLHLMASRIDQRGVILAPFGTIDLRATGSGTGFGELTLAAGSVTSTSAQGLVVPVGRTEGGLDWVYDLGNDQKLVLRQDLDPIPEQSIQLTGRAVDLAEGAVLDVSGGGDMQAYEFVPGVGGTRDVLSPTVSPNSYAIIPIYGDTIAPFDPQESSASNAAIGATVHLDGGGGLPAGEYALLPARYALLPGAYLITEVAGFRDITPGTQATLADGTPVMAGAYGVAGTAQVEDRTRGFSVVSSAFLRDTTNVHRPAEYTLSLASQFFPQQAAANGLVQTRLPMDAGTVSIVAGDLLNLQASLNGTPGKDGRGAAVDIASSHLVIGGAGSEGGVAIDAAALNRLGAESILLGGRRSSTASGVSIDVLSTDVTIADGASIVAPELILAASGQVTLADGASVAGQGTPGRAGASTYLVHGDGAVLRVAAGGQADIVRTGATGNSGAFTFADGARISADGSVFLDATGDIAFDGTLDLTGSLAVAASSVNLGDVPADATGFSLDGQQLAALGDGLDTLLLRSRGAINLFGDIDLQAKDLTLDSAGLVARSGDSATTASIRADRLTISNTQGATGVLPGTGGFGTLELSAKDAVLGAGTSTMAGFDRVALTANGSLLGSGHGGVRVVNPGSAAVLSITAGVIGGRNGAVTNVDADGAIEIHASGADVTASASLGASWSFTGESIADEGHIVAHGGRVALSARGPGGVTVGTGALIDVSGSVRDFGGVQAFAPGGDVRLQSLTGDVTVAAGAVVDVSGATGRGGQGGNAGTLRIVAPTGTVQVAGSLDGHAVAGQRGGRVELDGRTLQDFDAVNAALDAAGFNAERVYRMREGDLSIHSDVHAASISVTVDGANGTGGHLAVDGTFDASGAEGGQIRLVARDDITLASGARLDASASAPGQGGGTVELASAEGGVLAREGSLIVVGGGASGEGGDVHLRVRRAVLEQLVNEPGSEVMALDGTIEGARDIALEGYAVYDESDGIIDASEVQAFGSQAFLDADAFMQGASTIAAALGHGSDAAFHVRPGVEMSTDGDLRLAADWELSSWRFDGQQGYLTLRAGGDLIIDANLSDGFSPDYFAFMDQPAAASWSYRLAAGADFSSASPDAVKDRASGGNLLLTDASGAQRYIRTGTGRIEINTAGDLRLASDRSVIYTMGRPASGVSPQLHDFVLFEALQTASLAEQGGDIVIHAGGDVHGVASDQLITDWLWRTGSVAGNTYPSPTMWGVEFSRFRQGIGALGGGDVTIVAGGDVDNLSAAVPTIGVPTGLTQFDNEVSIRGGGNLRVEAAGDIVGGVYYVGRGRGVIEAGNDIRAGSGWKYLGQPIHTTIALGDAQVELTARGDLAIETAFNPTLLSPSVQQASNNTIEWLVDFSTYTPDSALSLVSTSGDVLIGGETSRLADSVSTTLAFDTARRPADVLRVLPSRVSAHALAGSIATGDDPRAQSSAFRLMPAPQGALELLAADDVRFVRTGYLISDANPRLLPTAASPQLPSTDFATVSLLNVLRPFGQFAHADLPVHSAAYAASVGYTGPRQSTTIVAQSGDIDMSRWNTSSQPVIWSAQPVKLIAGRDLIDPDVFAQNVESTDVSVFSAGRDLAYSVFRDATRRIVPRSSAITIDGPGEVLVLAGRNIDLKASPGIVTRGNTANPALANSGASLTLMAGLGPTRPDYAGFIDDYLAASDTYDAALAEYMKQRGFTGTPEATVAAFRALPTEQQVPFLTRVLFAELRARGREAVAAGDGDFTAGYAAIKSLFPDVDPEKMHTGDLSLFFSRVYTLDGGDIQALVPGGIVNVGLATPPAAFGISKSPSQLGIVAQSAGNVNLLSGGDILVNQSRVFVADGGSILMWSSQGDIDAGRGAKTAISAPPPVVTYDQNGNATVQFPAALTGSGIRAFVTTQGRKPGDVDLYAPTGIILVNDAGIGSAGNITIGATQVVGVGNIDVGGVAVGVPVDTAGLGANLSSVSASSSGATNSVAGEAGASNGEQGTPLADGAMSWLEVFVVGLGQDQCDQKDVECLKRQRKAQ